RGAGGEGSCAAGRQTSQKRSGGDAGVEHPSWALFRTCESYGPDAAPDVGRLWHCSGDDLRRAKAPAARGLDHEDVARVHFGLVAPAQLREASVRAHARIAPDPAGLAARNAIRRHAAMAGEHRRGHRFEKTDSPQRAIPAAPPSDAAAAPADREFLQHYRETPLEHLGIGET